MIRTTFFTSANRRYEFFAIPYVFSALKTNKDARAEICLEKTTDFVFRNRRATDVVADIFPGRVTFRDGNFAGRNPNIVRFLEQPQIQTDYVYIGDIDVLILEHITPIHQAMMAQLALPHSNIIRKGQPRLTGLHFTESKAHYPVLTEGFDIGGKAFSTDEQFLYFHVQRLGLLPPIEHQIRPLHGIHASLNRTPFGAPAWGLTNERRAAFKAVFESEEWSALAPSIDPRFLWIKRMIDMAFEGKDAFGAEALNVRVLGGFRKEWLAAKKAKEPPSIEA